MTKKQLRNAAIVSAPRELIVGNLYLMVGPPTLEDQASLGTWCRDQATKAKEAAGGIDPRRLNGLEPAERLIVLREYGRSLAAQESIAISEQDIGRVLTSPAGVSQQVYKAAKRHTPGVSLQEIQDVVTEENAMNVFVAFNRATTVEIEDDERGRRLQEDMGTGFPN